MSPLSIGAKKKLCLIVTGASRGLGRAIAVTFCQRYRSEEVIQAVVLVGRSVDGLQETTDMIRKNSTATTTAVSAIAQVVADLSDLDRLDENLDKILGYCCNGDQLVFVNNVGTLGHLGPCLDSPSLENMQKTVNLNVTGALWTSVRLARWATERNHFTGGTVIVNISSLAAVEPMATMAMYSAGKAARDSYHTAMAAETPQQKIKILNYAPGPLETDMSMELRQAEALDANLKPHFARQLIDPMDSAAVLVTMLQKDTFESGSHVDYYDILGETKQT